MAITVSPVNDAPVVQRSRRAGTIDENDSTTATVTFTDVEAV